MPEFKDKGITVHFIKEGFNTGNGNNMFKFMLTILSTVAEMECELTEERIIEGVAKVKIYGTKTGLSTEKGCQYLISNNTKM